MTHHKFSVSSTLVLLLCLTATTAFGAGPPEPPSFTWTTVVDNENTIPGTDRTFNSYNEPSVNANGLVVFRARSRGGGTLGMATQGIYTRDMSVSDSANRPHLRPRHSRSPGPTTWRPPSGSRRPFPASTTGRRPSSLGQTTSRSGALRRRAQMRPAPAPTASTPPPSAS